MALIKCCECNHDVSEYAEKCPNCGCPVNIIKQSIINDSDIENKLYTIINGEKKDVTYFVNKILDGSWDDDVLPFNCKLMDELDVSMMGFVNAVEECGGAPVEYNSKSISKAKQEQKQIQASKPKCPHCHSTNIAKISGTERAVSVLGMGLLSKKINKSFKCKSCGYTW